MAYQVAKKVAEREEILGTFTRREYAELFRSAYVGRMRPFWVVLQDGPEAWVVYDQEDDVIIRVIVR